MTAKERAIYYANRRIEQQDLLSAQIKKKYMESFKRVATMVYQSGVQPSFFQFSRYLDLDNSVNASVDKLAQELYKLIELYCLRAYELAQFKNETDDELDIIGYINRPISGTDLNLRLAEYTSDAKLEFEAFVAAGLILRKPLNALFSDFQANIATPYNSSIVRSSWKEKGAEIAAIRLLTKGVSFGKGKYVSAFNNLTRLGEGTANYAYNFADETFMQRSGAIGYQVYRGSSYPCQVCDDNTGFHPFGDYSLPVHSRCRCYATPVFA